METDLYVAGGYTVTNLVCNTAGGIFKGVPNTGLLDPPKFSTSLAQATGPTSSKSTRTSSTTTASSALTSSSTPPAPNPAPGGLSQSAKIGIGAGVGGGVGALLVAGIAFIFWRRHRKNKQRVQPPEISQAGHGPPTSYIRPPYNQTVYGQAPYKQAPGQQTQYNYSGSQQESPPSASPPPQWSSPSPPTSGSPPAVFGMPATYFPADGPRTGPQELNTSTSRRTRVN